MLQSNKITALYCRLSQMCIRDSCCGYNPYAFIAHTVQQRVKLPPPCGYGRTMTKREPEPACRTTHARKERAYEHHISRND